MQSDAIFWDRLAGMPMVEAEQELVLRRESIASEAASLMREKTAAEATGNNTAALALGRLRDALAAVDGRVLDGRKG